MKILLPLQKIWQPAKVSYQEALKSMADVKNILFSVDSNIVIRKQLRRTNVPKNIILVLGNFTVALSAIDMKIDVRLFLMK